MKRLMARLLGKYQVLAIATLCGFPLCAETALVRSEEPRQRLQAIAALAAESPMVRVDEGPFLMGTPRTIESTFGLELQYDDTEQPQRRVQIDAFEIDRDEVNLGSFLAWLYKTDRTPSELLVKLIDHVAAVHSVSPAVLTRWPALYVTWSEARDYCLSQKKRLPREAEWEKAARGADGKLFPWGSHAPTAELAMFGQYHVHEIPIVAAVDNGLAGQSPYGVRHMAGNAAEWVADWFGIDYYVTMPDRNPPGPTTGRYKVVRGGSWKSTPALLRTSTRSGAAPDQRAATIGFRCARSVQ
ncbi:MAG: SUMF1/EgtB/PvdO family nonheme iron enzyme [Nitrospiraceae bacterium]|nr:SUMF1/EgtB/PvdO family nonheme iron enzyme [Nitrospiraceae bacterium]